MSVSERVTLADVARAAGVSSATASKALSGRQRVSADAKRKVQEAALTLGFRPNRQAQSLALGQSETVGLITHDMEGRFSIPIMMGAEDAFGLDKVSVLLSNARGDSIRERYLIDALLERQIEGLIVVGGRPDPRPSLGDLPVPVVYAYAPSQNKRDMSVTVDNRQSGALAANYLLDLGRSRIAVVAGDASYGAATERVEGAQQALAEAGLEMVGKQALYGSWTEDWGRAATRILLGRHRVTPGGGAENQIDAMLCGSDHIARGVLDAIREEGLDSPRDIAVIGHDNWEIIAESARPPLSSIDMNLEELGRHSATRLLEAIEGHRQDGVEIVPSQLVVRASSAE